MGWETRGRRRYYYTARREGDRVVKTYLGTGETAALLGELDEYDRLKRQQEADEERAERYADDALAHQLAEVCDQVDALTRVALLLSGYHQHDRGEWRKRRDPQTKRRSGQRKPV